MKKIVREWYLRYTRLHNVGFSDNPEDNFWSWFVGCEFWFFGSRTITTINRGCILFFFCLPQFCSYNKISFNLYWLKPRLQDHLPKIIIFVYAQCLIYFSKIPSLNIIYDSNHMIICRKSDVICF